MATKKKKKKPGKAKKTPAKKAPTKKSAAKSKAPKKAAPARKPVVRKAKAAAARTRGSSENVRSVEYEPRGLGARSAGQSGDLQGLSDSAGADAESVDELLEEGNAFEAGVVEGVEDAPDADEGEIRTREVPEEDVPEEYLEGDEEDGPSRRGKTRP
jgi:hypothetical protein